MIRVVVVDDSVTMRRMMVRALESDPQIRVVNVVGDGQKAMEAARTSKPDLMTMDILMPGINGLDATRQIMRENPLPIVMVSAIGDNEEQRIGFEAMEAGALWVVNKPRIHTNEEWEKWSRNLIKIVKSMAEVKVVSRKPVREKSVHKIDSKIDFERPEVIAMAASTGGPNALRHIFSKLPADYSIPILVCQHITKGFLNGLLDWLQSGAKAPVRAGVNAGEIQRGVTLAPEHGHMEVSEKGGITIHSGNENEVYMPSADRLLTSVAKYFGKTAVGIILTGMGDDGCAGMKSLFDAGALTIGQDEASSLIYGMPGQAKARGALKYEMNPDQIISLLNGFSVDSRWKTGEGQKK